MIIEIKYKALHWDHHQGGSGKPFDGKLLRVIGPNDTASDILFYASTMLENEEKKNKTLIGDYVLTEIVIHDL